MSHLHFERLLADSFRRVHWRVQAEPRVAHLRPDLVVDAAGKTYVVELKRSPEGRKNRLIPLLSQAILQAQAMARQLPGPVVPLAVVAAERIPPSVAEQVKRFGMQFAPDVGVGVIDSQGLRIFAGHGLEVLDAQPPRPMRSRYPASQRLPHLFSDLNSWMLKISDIPARWILKRETHQLLAALRSYSSGPAANPRSSARARHGPVSKAQPRCAVGLFAAAGALGFGFVHGVPPYIYLERLDLDVIRRLGLSIDDRDRQADVYIRIPASKETVFRAAVIRHGLPISDILQVWLDVSTHPARGREQADEIRKRVLRPLIDKAL